MLTPEQSALVACEDPLVAVTAGAGAGKTATLVQRVAKCAGRLESVLVVSFTRAAAAEVAARLERELKGKRATAPRVTTFHGLAARVLRSYAEHFARMPNFTIYDEIDHDDTICLSGEDLMVKGVKTPEAILRRPGVRERLAARMRRANALCYDDLERLADQVSAAHGLGAVEGLYASIIVDEFQDTNAAQLRFIRRFMPHQLMVIGDPRQSIYSFRGAEPQTLVDLLGDPSWRRLDMTINFRSTPEVVEEGNRVAPAWPAIRAHRDHGAPIQRGAGAGQRADTVEIIKGWIADGLKPREIAIIGRTWRDIEHVRKALEEAEVPAELTRRTSLWDTPDARALSRLMRIRENAADANMAALVQLYLNKQANTDLHQRIADAEALAASGGVNVANVLFPWLFAVTATNPAEAAREIAGFIDREAAMEPALSALALHPWAEDETFLDWWDNRHEPAEKEDQEGPGAVQCITVHGSKGLEWPGVVVLGAEDPAIFPGKRGRAEGGDLNPEGMEAMRCLYVAITRARDRLALVRHQPTIEDRIAALAGPAILTGPQAVLDAIDRKAP